jgi:hypothetical protein
MRKKGSITAQEEGRNRVQDEKRTSDQEERKMGTVR